MTRFSVEQTVLEKTLNYLATKPYNEVVQLIAAIQQDAKVIEEPLTSAANP